MKQLFAYSLAILLFLYFALPSSADVSPAGCVGSGLGINLFTDSTSVHIGDNIKYSLQVYNGTGIGDVMCDASDIVASLTTPDGVIHPITLTRTSLSNGQSDYYPDVVTYTSLVANVQGDNTLKASASDSGTIHQNDVNTAGSAYQGVNTFVVNDLHVIKNVVNANGGTAQAADFNIHIKKGGVDVGGSPFQGSGAPGNLFPLILGDYVISEDPNPGYLVSFSGDCDANGNITLSLGDNKTCTITNTDLAPTPTVTPTTTPTVTTTVTPTPTSTDGGGGGGGNGGGDGGSIGGCPPGEITAIPVLISSTRISPTSINLTWGPFQGYSNFIIEYGTSSTNLTFSTRVSGFTTTLNDLPANTPIWVRIAITDDCDTGPFSSTVLVGQLTPALPFVPLFPDTGGRIPLLPDTGFGNRFSLFELFLRLLSFLKLYEP